MLHQAMEHVFNRCPSQYIIHTSSAVTEITHSLFPLCVPATNWHRVPIRTIKMFLYVFGVMLFQGWEKVRLVPAFRIIQKVMINKIYFFSVEICKIFCHSDVAQKRTLNFLYRFIKIIIPFCLTEMSKASVSATYLPKIIKTLKKDILR